MSDKFSWLHRRKLPKTPTKPVSVGKPEIIKSNERTRMVRLPVAQANYIEEIKQNQMVITQPYGVPLLPKQPTPVYSSYIEDTNRMDFFFEDPEIQRMQLIMIKPSPQNTKWLANHDNSVISSRFILAQAVKGANGLQVKTKNKRIKKALNKLHTTNKINKVIIKSIAENISFADSVWWKDYKPEEQMIYLKWVDYVTLTPITNSEDGGIKWVQYTMKDPNMPKKSDSNAFKKYEPPMDYWKMTPYYPQVPVSEGASATLMEDDVIHFNLFISPPMDGIREVVSWKKMMQFDGKKGGHDYASPLIKISVDLPETYSITEEETTALLNKIAEDFSYMYENFGTIAYPKEFDVQTDEHSGQVFHFTNYLEYAEKMIHKAILVPVNLLDSTGTELATSRTTKDMFGIVVDALRDLYKDVIKDFDMEYLEFIGIKAEPEDFELIFDETDKQQRFTHNEEFQAIMQLWDRGAMKDVNEVREYMQKFGVELPQLTDKELQLMREEEMRRNLQEQIDFTGFEDEEEPTDQDINNDVMNDIKKEMGKANA